MPKQWAAAALSVVPRDTHVGVADRFATEWVARYASFLAAKFAESWRLGQNSWQKARGRWVLRRTAPFPAT